MFSLIGVLIAHNSPLLDYTNTYKNTMLDLYVNICYNIPMSKFEKLDNKVKKLLDKTESKMNSLIEEYNESLNEDSDDYEVDVVDLDGKFDTIRDYVTDYSS
jgi:hypothetical protein